MNTSAGPQEILGALLRAGLPFPVLALAVVGEIVIVLFHPDAGLDTPGQFENLRAYRADGSEIWRGELPTSTSSDCFVSLTGGDSRSVVGRSFSGYRTVMDVATGRVEQTEFLK